MSELEAGKHIEEVDAPEVRSTLVDISKAIYTSLIGLAKGRQGAAKSLDDVAEELKDEIAQTVIGPVAG